VVRLEARNLERPLGLSISDVTRIMIIQVREEIHKVGNMFRNMQDMVID
jgi:hypothetical protein